MSVLPTSRAASLLADTSDSLRSVGAELCAAGCIHPTLALVGGAALGCSTGASIIARQLDFDRKQARESTRWQEEMRDGEVRRFVLTEDQNLRSKTLEADTALAIMGIQADVLKTYISARRDVAIAQIEGDVHLARAASAERIEAERSRERVHTSFWFALSGCCRRRSPPSSFAPTSDALLPLRGLTLEALLVKEGLSEEQKEMLTEQFDLIAARAPSELNSFIAKELSSFSRKKAEEVWQDLFAKYSTLT